MEITGRDDALQAPATSKSKLKAFEQRLHNLHGCTEDELIEFLKKENCEFISEPGVLNVALVGLDFILNDSLKLAKYLGKALESDFMYVKKAQGKKKSALTWPPQLRVFPQRFHGRVYIADREIVIVSETETNPMDIGSIIRHLFEKHEHRIIRLRKNRGILKGYIRPRR